jgi:ribokinase
MDLAVVTKVIPDEGETIIGDSFFANPGGKGANQAVAIAKMGANVEMVGAVGKEFGNDLINALNSYHVSTKFVKKYDNISSGTATIIVTNGENRIIINSAANSRISKQDIDLALLDAKEGDYLLCQLEVPLSVVEYALSQAKVKGMMTCLNPAPYLALPPSLFHQIDYLIPNQSETKLYTGIYPHDLAEAKQASLLLLEKGVKNVLITLGEKGSYFYNSKEEHFIPAYQVPAIDTTGAGDTYIGAFLTMLSEGKSIKEAMTLAGLAASITIQRLGAQKAIPYRHELEQRIHHYENQ